MIATSFLVFLMIFTLVGIASVKFSESSDDDYLLAGSGVKPWLVALSAVATNNSGFMFIGMIGYTYAVGLSSLWISLPWILGDLLASFTSHKRLRATTSERHALTFSGLLSTWTGSEYRWVKILSAVLIVVLLGTYAAAQLKAGSKALFVLFDWDYAVGAILGALIVLAYCFKGGIRASIWTDAAQSFVMIVAMAMLAVTAVVSSGGWEAYWQQLQSISPDYMNWFPAEMPFGPILGAVALISSWFFAGFGVVGQPHVMVRFMTMAQPDDMTRVRIHYYSWYTLFQIATIITGLSARLLLPVNEAFDAELALPTLSQHLLPDVFVGLVLAGLFAATISTADSQILSSAAALTHDLGFGKSSYTKTRWGTVLVTAVALGIALFGPESVFALVLIAWSALGSAFAPLLVVLALGGKPTERVSVSMMLSGLGAMLIWREMGFSDAVYEILPGMLAGFIVFWVGHFVPKIMRR